MPEQDRVADKVLGKIGSGPREGARTKVVEYVTFPIRGNNCMAGLGSAIEADYSFIIGELAGKIIYNLTLALIPIRRAYYNCSPLHFSLLSRVSYHQMNVPPQRCRGLRG